MADKKQIGVITEQGFVMGDNLGFKPVKENQLNNNNNSSKEKKEDDKKKKTSK